MRQCSRCKQEIKGPALYCAEGKLCKKCSEAGWVVAKRNPNEVDADAGFREGVDSNVQV